MFAAAPLLYDVLTAVLEPLRPPRPGVPVTVLFAVIWLSIGCGGLALGF